MGLIDEIHPAVRARRNPGLLYLTDLGIAAIAIDQKVDPVHLVRRSRLRGADLLARVLALPHLLALYQLLAALAAARRGQIDLLAWEQPWRQTFRRPNRRSPITVEIPGYAALSWDDEVAECFLVPDLATFTLRAHRQTLARLMVLRPLVGGAIPRLVVATTEARRTAWTRLIDDVARSQRDVPLMARVVTWQELRDNVAALGDVAADASPSSTFRLRPPTLRPLEPRQPGSPIPRPIGDALQPGSSTGSLGRLALEVTPMERSLLDLVGRHPFLPANSLATVLGWEVRRVRERRERLISVGLVRLVDRQESGRSAVGDLSELTVHGLEFVAAHQGLSLVRAVQLNGLAGGGPDHPTGTRQLLLRNLDHTLGVDALFISLIRTLAATATTSEGDAFLEWRNTAACSRRRVRPDGYGMIRRGGELYGFFLEYDRGTMSARDYREKWAAYYDYRDSRDFERDYDGFPTILVVTTHNSAEERIARAALAASIGRSPLLPLLLTCQWRIDRNPANPDGLLGPIWREPSGCFDDRRSWPSGWVRTGAPQVQDRTRSGLHR